MDAGAILGGLLGAVKPSIKTFIIISHFDQVTNPNRNQNNQNQNPGNNILGGIVNAVSLYREKALNQSISFWVVPAFSGKEEWKCFPENLPQLELSLA